MAIVSASYRSDVPAFWSDWFRSCLALGHCDIPNPYSGRQYRVDLRPEAVDGFVFWTRNIAPFGEALREVSALGLPFFVQFTVTGFSRSLDPHTPDADAAIAQIGKLANMFGPSSTVWRYDPIVFTSFHPPEWHVENFARLAGRLAGTVDECVVSFAHMYRKTRSRLEHAAKEHGFALIDIDAEERRFLLQRIAPIAAENGIALNLCTQPAYVTPSVGAARCIDPDRLSYIAGRDVRARRKGNRAGCLCAESRDIGRYDSCAHGCVYCYAVSSHDMAVRRVQAERGGAFKTPSRRPNAHPAPKEPRRAPGEPR